MRHIAVVSLAMLAGCHSTSVLEPPPVGNARTVVLTVERANGAEAVWVLDGANLELPRLEYRDALDLGAVGFSCSPSELGLAPGLQNLVEPEMRSKLPQPMFRLRASVKGGTESPWTEAPAPDMLIDRVLESLDLPAERLCELYPVPVSVQDISYREARTSSPAVFGVPLKGGDVLVGTLAGQFLRVGPTGEPLRLTRVSTTTPHQAAYRASDGEIWLFDGRGGQVARGDPENGFRPVEARSAGGAFEIVRVDGARGDAPFEAFLVSDARTFERFDGVRFTTLATAAPDRSRDERYLYRPSVAWVGPGRALAVNIDRTGLIHRYENDHVTMEAAPEELGRPAEIAWIEGFGVMLGGSRGRIGRLRDDGTWEMMETGLPTSVRAMAPLGGNLLVAGIISSRTFFAQFNPIVGGCDQESYTPGVVVALVPLANGGVLGLSASGGSDDRNIVRLVRLDIVKPPPACLQGAVEQR